MYNYINKFQFSYSEHFAYKKLKSCQKMNFIEVQIQFHKDAINIHKKQLILLDTLLNENQLVPRVSDNDIYNIDDLQISSVNGINDIDLADDEHDKIWHRIIKAHPDEYENKVSPNQHKKNNLQAPDISMCDSVEKLEPKSDMIASNSEVSNKSQTGNCKKNPPINKLSKYNTKQQSQIIRNIFAEAKNNISKLALIDKSLNDDINTHIQIEADRLLQIYLMK